MTAEGASYNADDVKNDPKLAEDCRRLKIGKRLESWRWHEEEIRVKNKG